MRKQLGAAPASPPDAATKAYVDAHAGGASGGQVNQVVAGDRIDVDSTDPTAPVVSLTPLARQTVTSTATLDNGAHTAVHPVLGTTYRLISIQTSKPARVRIYSTDAARLADQYRDVGTDPASDAGVILEYVTTDTATHTLSPVVTGCSLEDPPDEAAVVIIRNDGTSGDVSVTFVFERIA